MTREPKTNSQVFNTKYIECLWSEWEPLKLLSIVRWRMSPWHCIIYIKPWMRMMMMMISLLLAGSRNTPWDGAISHINKSSIRRCFHRFLDFYWSCFVLRVFTDHMHHHGTLHNKETQVFNMISNFACMKSVKEFGTNLVWFLNMIGFNDEKTAMACINAGRW